MIKQFFERITWVDFFLRVFQIASAIVILVGLYNTFTSSPYTPEQWATLVFAGLAQGSIYALIALGYTLVYGVLLMINFAHGEVYMAGAFSTVFLARYMATTGFLDANPIIAIVIMILFAAMISTLVAVLLERIAYRPLRNAPRLIPLITAIGASFALQYTFRGLYGAEFTSYPEVKLLQGHWNVLGFQVPIVQLVVFFAALVLMFALYWYVERTKTGKAMRACSYNRTAARLVGINPDSMVMLAFGMSAAIGALAGAVFLPITGATYANGAMLGLKGFCAAVLGGLGNYTGAVVAGLALGVLESLSAGSNIPSDYKDAIALGVLLIVLFIRPSGLFGKAELSKLSQF